MTWARMRRLGAVALLAAAAYELASRRRQLLGGLELLRHPDFPLVGVAVAAEAISLLAMAREEWLFLQPGRVHIGTFKMAELTAAHNAITMSVPGGVAWSTAFLFDQLRRRGADRTLAGWAILASGAVSSFSLFLILAAAVEMTSTGPTTGAKVPIALLAAIPPMVAVVAAAVHGRGISHEDVTSWIKGRLHRWPGALRWVETTSRRMRRYQPSGLQWARSFVMSFANWGFDLACLVFSIRALSSKVPWPGVLVAYVLAKVAGMLPITPGGIGVVEAGLTGLLVVYGMSARTAWGATLLYRFLSFWVLLPIGWGYWGLLKLRGPSSGGPPVEGAQSR